MMLFYGQLPEGIYFRFKENVFREKEPLKRGCFYGKLCVNIFMGQKVMREAIFENKKLRGL